MSSWSRARFHEVVRSSDVDLGRACLLLAGEFSPELDDAALTHWLGVLDALAAEVPAQGSPASQLRQALGAFHGDSGVYADLQSSLLPEVLRRRRGLPILLSVVYVEVARRAGIPAWGVGLPGHFVVGVGDPEGRYELLDPFRRGARLSVDVPLTGTAALVRPWSEVEILTRVLANIRRWAERPDRVRTELRAVDLLLLLPGHPMALRRERGRLMVRSGDVAGGAAALEDYAEAVSSLSPSQELETRREARMARSSLN